MSEVIVADIGGTHTRFGLWKEGGLERCVKLKTADFISIPESIAAYQGQHNLGGIKNFAFATAANPFADGTWHFSNLADHAFSVSEINDAGYKVLLAEDDFSATTRGCLSIAENDNNILTVKKGEGRKGDPKIVLGPGTGLGMGYAVYDVNGKFLKVQKAYGGHMLFTPITQTHRDISDRIAKKRNLTRSVIFEDIACGSSFGVLYEVCCDILDEKPAAHFFADTHHPAFQMALAVFHETLGLFAHLSVVTIHGFGGVIMNGGFLDALIERKLWNPQKFLNAFHQTGVPIVTEDILKTPISIVTDTYISLVGLGKMLDA